MDHQIRRLLAVFMIASLVLAPLARPVMADTMSDASMSDTPMTEDMSVSATATSATTMLSPLFPDSDKIPQSSEMTRCATKRHAAVAAENAKWRGHLSGDLSEIPQGLIRPRSMQALLRHRSQGQRTPGASLSV